MIKIVIMAVMVLGIGTAHAQTVNGVDISDLRKQAKYVELLGTAKLLKNEVVVSVDFGQQVKSWSNWTGKKTMLKDAEGKNVALNSMVDAMNFFHKHGYEFTQAYVVTVGSGTYASNVYHWLLTRIED